MNLPKPLECLVGELKKLPGVGEKTATRYVVHLFQRGPQALMDLAEALQEAAQKVGRCEDCGFLAEAREGGPEGPKRTLCAFCLDPLRDHSTICVVEGIADVLAVEKVGDFKGLYHVLGGAISALRGKSPQDLRIEDLVRRVLSGGVKEVILATSADAEGETTALYIKRVLSEALEKAQPDTHDGEGREVLKAQVRITRPATGIPMGSAIEYLDAVTLMRAFRGRKEMA